MRLEENNVGGSTSNPGPQCHILYPVPRERCNAQLARVDPSSVPVTAKLDLNSCEAVLDFVHPT